MQKTIRYLLILLALALPAALRAQRDTVACPEPAAAANAVAGEATDSTIRMPLATNYRYSYCEVIVDSADLAPLAGHTIEYWAFMPQTVADGSLLNEQCAVYMGHTSHSGLNSGLLQNLGADFQEVYVGSLNFSEAGEWRIVQLQQPFEWDGHSNIVVAVNRASQQFGQPCRFVAWRNTGIDMKARYVCSDDAPFVLGTITANAHNLAEVPYYKFLSCSDMEVSDTCLPPTGLHTVGPSVPNPGENTVSQAVAWDGDAFSYDLDCMNLRETEEFVFYSVFENTETFPSLKPNTDYKMRIRAHCEPWQESEWSGWVRFSTGALAVSDLQSPQPPSLTPNPTTDGVTLARGGIQGDIRFTVSDMEGRVLTEGLLGADVPRLRLDTAAWPRGLCLVQLAAEGYNGVIKLIIK